MEKAQAKNVQPQLLRRQTPPRRRHTGLHGALPPHPHGFLLMIEIRRYWNAPVDSGTISTKTSARNCIYHRIVSHRNRQSSTSRASLHHLGLLSLHSSIATLAGVTKNWRIVTQFRESVSFRQASEEEGDAPPHVGSLLPAVPPVASSNQTTRHPAHSKTIEPPQFPANHQNPNHSVSKSTLQHAVQRHRTSKCSHPIPHNM